ncbi:MAG TPA: M20 family metallo-hydrolase [Acidimicrobiales bacterium]|nr:M20 family metallo-hydrolase [Acidimicrobiales bacterium]
MTDTSTRIDVERVLGRLEDLATIGAIAETTGVARLALSDDDREGRNLVVSWMRDLGLDIRVDAIGNVAGVWEGREPNARPVMCGSHIDTVKTGGRYDGAYGVLAGLEVIESLIERGIRPRRPIAVAFFTDEEGSRYAPDMLGSLVYVGGMTVEAARDVVGIDGTVLGVELDRIGYAGPLPCPMVVPHAFVELHIEQGPALEAGGYTIGAVTGVQGISWQELTFVGQSNHAGTTPMAMRRDAGYVAALVASHVREMVTDIGGVQVGTVGAIDLHPNLVNVVAARATMTVDLRNTDDEVLREAEKALDRFVERAARDEGVAVESRQLARFEPVRFDERLVELVEASARAFGYRVRRLPSGAGHDAQMLARLCPAAMIFVPSHDGLSHNVAEHTDPDDLAAGINVLFEVLLQLAEED